MLNLSSSKEESIKGKFYATKKIESQALCPKNSMELRIYQSHSKFKKSGGIHKLHWQYEVGRWYSRNVNSMQIFPRKM